MAAGAGAKKFGCVLAGGGALLANGLNGFIAAELLSIESRSSCACNQ